MIRVVALWLVLAAVASAGQFDMAALQKWQAARIVHYSVRGAFEGSSPLASTPYATVEVKDTVAVEFDWDVRAQALVGAARVTNAPTTVVTATSGLAKCPPPAMQGTFEYFDAAAASRAPGGLELKGTRSFPAAKVSSEWPASCEPKPVPAHQDAVTVPLAVVPAMMLVMPAGDPRMTVSPDRTSFTIRTNDWAWTYTPSVVK